MGLASNSYHLVLPAGSSGGHRHLRQSELQACLSPGVEGIEGWWSLWPWSGQWNEVLLWGFQIHLWLLLFRFLLVIAVRKGAFVLGYLKSPGKHPVTIQGKSKGWLSRAVGFCCVLFFFFLVVCQKLNFIFLSLYFLKKNRTLLDLFLSRQLVCESINHPAFPK